MSKSKASTARVRVPATTANLGPGFDCLGVALKLYNTVRLTRDDTANLPEKGMLLEATVAFFDTAKVKPFEFSFSIDGEVPQSRGLGSSVTVRAGIVAGLNALAGEPLTPAECLNIVISLEGHPDNAAPAFLGGFAVSSDETILRTEVDERLRFCAVIPELELETEKARKVLPKTVPFAHAVDNARRAAVISAAFTSKRYELLSGAFVDHLHQPFRKALLPQLDDVISGGLEAGALGGFLSGSGSTIICLALEGEASPSRILKAMCKPFEKAGISVRGLDLQADNKGIKVSA